MGFLKSILIVGTLGLAAALAPGDCAFVGVYGDHDDFALVLLEDVNGETIQITEALPQNGFLEVTEPASAKSKVSDALRGAVLKRADFQMDATSFVAPLGLTAFTGSSESPTVLCSINLDHSVRKLEEFTVSLGLTDSAEYGGKTSGSKEQLLEDIMDPHNWHRDQVRRLGTFTVASGSNATATMTMTTTLTVADGVETQVEGCLEVSVSDFALLDGSASAKEAINQSIAAAAEADPSYVKDLTIMIGACGGSSQARRLAAQSVSISFRLVFPASLGASAIVQAAAAVAAIQGVSSTDFTTTIAAKIAEVAPEIASQITITVTSVASVSVTFEETGTAKADGCFEFYTNDYAALSGFASLVSEWTSIHAMLFGVDTTYVTNVAMQSGACTFSRRLAERRLQELGCAKFQLQYAPSQFGGIQGAYDAALANVTQLATASLADISATITTQLQTNADLVNVTVDVVAVDLKITESGTSTTTTTTGEVETPSHAAATGFALGLLMLFLRI